MTDPYRTADSQEQIDLEQLDLEIFVNTPGYADSIRYPATIIGGYTESYCPVNGEEFIPASRLLKKFFAGKLPDNFIEVDVGHFVSRLSLVFWKVSNVKPYKISQTDFARRPKAQAIYQSGVANL